MSGPVTPGLLIHSTGSGGSYRGEQRLLPPGQVPLAVQRGRQDRQDHHLHRVRHLRRIATVTWQQQSQGWVQANHSQKIKLPWTPNYVFSFGQMALATLEGLSNPDLSVKRACFFDQDLPVHRPEELTQARPVIMDSLIWNLPKPIISTAWSTVNVSVTNGSDATFRKQSHRTTPLSAAHTKPTFAQNRRKDIFQRRIDTVSCYVCMFTRFNIPAFSIEAVWQPHL